MIALVLLAACTTHAAIELGTIYEDCTSVVPAPPVDYLDEPTDADDDDEVYGAAPGPLHEHQGLPARDPSVSRSFLWSTDTDTLASELQIGPADTWPVGSTTYGGQSFLFDDDEPTREHEVRVCGLLRQKTRYTWRVGGPEAWSALHTFSTPGAPGTFDTERMVWMGDSRSDMNAWGTVATMALGFDPDVILFSGDAVDSGEAQDRWDDWWDASGGLLADVPWVGVLGHHEAQAQNWYAQFGLPHNEQWYAVDWGNLRLIGTSDQAEESVITGEEADWQADAVAEGGPWHFVVNHEPPWSIGSIHKSNLTLREAWGPIWDAGGVEAVVSGHNHAYERSVPITGEVEDPAGVTYVVSGGAGAPLYDESAPDWYNVVYSAVHHLVVVDVTGDTAVGTAYATDGTIVDTFTLAR